MRLILMSLLMVGCVPLPGGEGKDIPAPVDGWFVVTDSVTPKVSAEPVEVPVIEVPEPSIEATPPKPEKPWMNVYVNAHGCPGCNQFKAWLAEQDKDSLPVEFRIKTEAPSWVSAVPCFHWNTSGGKSYYDVGWNGPQQIFAKWSSSQKQTANTQSEKVEIKYEPGANFHMECSGGACRMVRH